MGKGNIQERTRGRVGVRDSGGHRALVSGALLEPGGGTGGEGPRFSGGKQGEEKNKSEQ